MNSVLSPNRSSLGGCDLGQFMVDTRISVMVPFVNASVTVLHSALGIVSSTVSEVDGISFVGFECDCPGSVLITASSSVNVFSAGLSVVCQLDSWAALGISSRSGAVSVLPEIIFDEYTQLNITVQANNWRAYFNNSQKARIPYDGPVHGVELYFVDAADIDYWNIAIVRKEGSTFKVVGRTEQRTEAPTSKTKVWFDKHVYAKAGDYYALEVHASANVAVVPLRNLIQDNAVSRLHYSNSAQLADTFLAGDYPEYSILANLITDLAVLMPPPAIVIAGHSIMAGHTSSHTFYEDTDSDFVAAGDPAWWMQKLLGVPCANVADGGTSTGSWIDPANGRLFTTVEQLLPGAVVYNAHYNEAAGYTADPKAYLERYDVLLSLCDAIATELVVAEGYVATHTWETANPQTSVDNQNAIYSLRAWSALHGLLWVPQNYRIGMNVSASTTAGNEDAGQRWSIKDGSKPLQPDYRGETSGVHLNAAGQKAQAMAIVQRIRNRPIDAMNGLLSINTGIAADVMPPNLIEGQP